MGSGKSSVGAKLAHRLGYEFVDTDSLVEQRAGKSIREIFEQEGEQVFRHIESEVIAEISQGERQVISCGGGAILNPESVEALRQKGRIVYLKGDPGLLYERVKEDDERPLLNVDSSWEEFQRIFAKRKGKYEKSADIVVEVGEQEQAEIVEEIVNLLGGAQ
jgi:shikimate kinase